jgi:cell division protein FtsB
VIFTFLLLLIAYLGITLVFEENGLLKYLELKNKKIELLSEIKALQEENIKLKEEIELIKKDPFYIEKKAREELNLSRPDEYIFLFEN